VTFTGSVSAFWHKRRVDYTNDVKPWGALWQAFHAFVFTGANIATSEFNYYLPVQYSKMAFANVIKAIYYAKLQTTSNGLNATAVYKVYGKGNFNKISFLPPWLTDWDNIKISTWTTEQ